MSAQFEERADDVKGRSIPQLFRDFTSESSNLLRDELALAKAEMSEKISEVGDGISSLGAGALVLFAGFLVLLDAVVLLLMKVISPDNAWLSPLIVGGVVAIIGAIMLANGRSRMKARNLKPRETLAEVKRDGKLLKEKLS